MNITCAHQSHGKKIIPQKYLHAHHIFPKEFGGTDKDGRILLCQKHHIELHRMFREMRITRKEDFLNYTNLWLNHKKEVVFCSECKSERPLSISQIGSNYLILQCVLCGHTEKNFSLFPSFMNEQIKEGEKAWRVEKNESLF